MHVNKNELFSQTLFIDILSSVFGTFNLSSFCQNNFSVVSAIVQFHKCYVIVCHQSQYIIEYRQRIFDI